MPSVLCDNPEKLSELLNLLGFEPSRSNLTEEAWSDWQDWDLEFADPRRISDFIKVYRESQLTSAQKVALGALILSSFEKALDDPGINHERIAEQIEKLLGIDKSLHVETLQYWARSGGPIRYIAATLQHKK